LRGGAYWCRGGFFGGFAHVLSLCGWAFFTAPQG
jgi:hypothetical protein